MRTFLQRPKRSVHRNLEKEDKEVRTRKVVVRYDVGDKGLPVRGRCTPGDPLLPKVIVPNVPATPTKKQVSWV